jgi:hypothetical protein
MRVRTYLCLVVSALLLWSAAAAAQTVTKDGTVKSTPDAASRKLTLIVDQNVVTVSVLGDSAKDKLATLSAGDEVRLDVNERNEAQANTIRKINQIVEVGPGRRLLAALIAFLIILIVALYCARWRPFDYFIGIDNRVSNSQTQLVLWSVTVFTVYLTTLLLRAYYGWAHVTDTLGGIDIPGNLLALSGLSALSFAGARAVTASKDGAAKAANATAGIPVQKEKTIAAAGSASLHDLFRSDGRPAAGANPAVPPKVDLGDTQMILVTLIAVAIYLIKSYAFLGHVDLSPHVSLPEIDTTLLSAFGIGQGAYLAKKAASDPGDG